MCVYIYIYVCVCVYIYAIYMHTCRARGGAAYLSNPSRTPYIYLYIYVYMVYIYREKERGGYNAIKPLTLFGQNFRFVLGGLSRCFNCSIPRARFASYHHTRETLKRARSCTLLSPQLSLSLILCC